MQGFQWVNGSLGKRNRCQKKEVVVIRKNKWKWGLLNCDA